VPSSSNEILFARPLADARIVVHDGARGPQRSGPARFDLKEIQRRAFERGQAVERERGSRAFAALCAELREQVAAQAAAREDDRRRVEEFATRLALVVAEKLTFATIDAASHDVAGLVRTLLGELGAPAEETVRIRLSPGDHGLLLESAARGELNIEGLEISPDQALQSGSAVLATDEVEYWSDLNDRIERLRGIALAEAAHD
jgi:flagellar biosynthesis/type III secretory pathway protein FliH